MAHKFEPSNVAKLQFMQWAIYRDKHDEDDTLQLALTHKQLACVVSGIILLDMIMPEYARVTGDLMEKLAEVSGAQDFFSTRVPEDFEPPPMFEDLDDGE